MPVNCIPSGEQVEVRQKSTARKRRRNQNDEIDELAALLPIKPSSLSGLKQPAIDKISVLRLSSSYLKFQQFLESTYTSLVKRAKTAGLNNIFSEALDGFLLVLDKDANILFVSECITNFVGLTQHDVIGQNLVDLAHKDDEEIIKEKLTLREVKPLPSNSRQFYVRFKSTLSPGRMQLSRFTSHTMVQVSGSLKVHIPDKPALKAGEEPQVLGLVAECRLIESSSILEISIPQSTFTSTVSLDMRILSVESSIREVIGYESADFVGTTFQDYFHPSDLKKMVPCENLLLRTGHGVSPIFRFMTHTGDWVWMQLDGMVRYKKGTKEPQFLEVKAKVISQHEGKLKFIEQKELYGTDLDPHQDLLNPHRDNYFLEKLPKTGQPCEQSPTPIVQSLKSINMPQPMINSVLHARELGLQNLPKDVKPVLTEKELGNYVVRRNARIFEGFYPELLPESEAAISALKDSFSNLGYELPSDIEGGMTTENIMRYMEDVSRASVKNESENPGMNHSPHPTTAAAAAAAAANGMPTTVPVQNGTVPMAFNGSENGAPGFISTSVPFSSIPASNAPAVATVSNSNGPRFLSHPSPSSSSITGEPSPPVNGIHTFSSNQFFDPAVPPVTGGGGHGSEVPFALPPLLPQQQQQQGVGEVFDPTVYGTYLPENFNFDSKDVVQNQLADFNTRLQSSSSHQGSSVHPGMTELRSSDRAFSSDSLMGSKSSVTSVSSPTSVTCSLFSPDSGVMCHSVGGGGGGGGGVGGFSPQSVFSPQQNSIPSPELQNGTRFVDSPDSGHPSSPARSQPPSVAMFPVTDNSIPQTFIPQQQYPYALQQQYTPATPPNDLTNGIADGDLQQILCDVVTLNADNNYYASDTPQINPSDTTSLVGGGYPHGGAPSQRNDVQELLQQLM